MTARSTPILPLPEHVVAQIKSSAAIVSLADVVLGLLKNAFDAGATKLDATVDWARGACSVEDNGLGIPPLEFRPGGGLGKLHCTSKYSIHSDETYFGRNGTFLASLAAVSLLTITSHHHAHLSHNSITFHHAKPIDRQLPVSPHHEIGCNAHGTRVTVRNLFGNLPVRVKQRAVAAEHKVEHDRLRESLKRKVTGLVLGWGQAVSLKIRDAENRVVLHINGKQEGVDGTGGTRERSKPLHTMLNTLAQMEYISIADWKQWVPAAASTSTISIKGAISLEPCPNKLVQFVSLGIRPLFADNGHNALYDEVNRIFALSSFGTVEDDADINENEKIRRQTDMRFKTGSHTNRQLRGRKGVDRYPMFYLRVHMKDSISVRESEEQFLEDANLQSILEVLDALLTQWLSTHHFRPRHLHTRKKLTKHTPHSSSGGNISKFLTSSTPRSRSDTPEGSSASSIPAPVGIRKRKRSTCVSSDKKPDALCQIPFMDWSRIKSGKAEFYQNLWASKKQDEDVLPCEQSPTAAACATFDAEPILPGAFSGHFDAVETLQETEACIPAQPSQDGTSTDQTITWYDKATRQTFLLNARTGCMVPEHTTRPQSDDVTAASTKTMRLQPRPVSATLAERSFLSGILNTWENPIFKPSEKNIHQVSLHEHCFDGNHNQRRIDIQKAFTESSLSAKSKLSKDGLRKAQVICQLDKKFVLVKMDQGEENAPQVLVLIDQHAADERIRVETLLTELCTPLTNQSQYSSNLGHSSRVAFTVLEKPLKFSVSAQEHAVFLAHAARLGHWGILFDLPDPGAMPTEKEKASLILSVTTLPPSIAERCKADPKLLISFLRSAVWKYAENSHLSSHLSQPTEPERSSSDGMPPWVRQISKCPEGLVDFVNSRACRSAIMFNDELSLSECQELVAKLSGCVFPFMCAHGRPSMVPLVNLGTQCSDMGLGLGGGMDEAMGHGGQGSFAEAWKAWRARKV